MSAPALAIGLSHFVGIGGIGMSGIAEILHSLGHRVQGSDVAESANVKRLAALGIPIAIGHSADNLGDCEIVVVSSAIKGDNPEIAAARARQVPVIQRAEMLGELMRLQRSIAVGGTHGKTTTTSLIAAAMAAGGLDPTVINGGIINSYGTNAYLGTGEWMVVEADESDGSFVKLPADIAIITNIDREHIDHYGSYGALKDAFRSFVGNISIFGFAVLCLDDAEVQELISNMPGRRIVTYGINRQADIRAVNLEMSGGISRYDVIVTGRDGIERTIAGVRLPMLGRHNVLNSLAAVAVASELGVGDKIVREALNRFAGVKRRFTRTGEAQGVTVIDDYGHHPVEIAAVLGAARAGSDKGHVIAVVQPHRYTRLKDLFEGFCTCCNDADTVIVADVYTAGEDPIAGFDRESLVAGLRSHGHRHVLALAGPEKLAELVHRIARPGDTVVCLGAGSISAWAQSLPAELDALGAGKKKAGAKT